MRTPHGSKASAGTLSLALAVILLLAAREPLRGQEPLDLDVLLDRLGTYLERYESELSPLIADERYRQEERRGTFRLRARVTEGEVLFLRLPGEAEWFGVRDVRRVDGRAVGRIGLTLSELFSQPGGDLLQRAAAIVLESSKHNLGEPRTINMPTVPLEALSARHHPRYIFNVRGTERVRGVRTVRLEFSEFDEPTLVHTPTGTNLWSRGTAWIDPTTGALWRADLLVSPDPPDKRRRGRFAGTLRVEFEHDASTGVIVPREMMETFGVRNAVGFGSSRYSNYRRFATGARLVK